jgi:hypothetical protein
MFNMFMKLPRLQNENNFGAPTKLSQNLRLKLIDYGSN